MALIHLLDSETIDKIAAGEVVERPASIVKELVENAIDAGARAVTVEAKDGGIELVRVTDNGSGMEKNQIRTAFLRHATSKINDANDLNRISSLGFRGEALSSISAVTKVEIITKTNDSLTGTRMVIEGGVEKDFQEIGAPEGTTFLVRNIFYNTPVRRKFLKQPATEGGYITELMEHLALSRPDISFKFVLGNQTRFHTSGNGDLKEVIYRIYGREIANAVVPIQVKRHGISIEGYLGKPILVRSNRNFEIYYINGRFIKSNVVAKSIEEGYKEYLMQHKFPFCVLHITMDTERVDVNVHPTKMDVRFSDNLLVGQVISEAVRDVLRGKEMIPQSSLFTDKELRHIAQEEENSDEKIADKKDKQKSPEPFELKRQQDYRVKEQTSYETQQKPTRDFRDNPVWQRVKSAAVMDRNPSVEVDQVESRTAVYIEEEESADSFVFEEEIEQKTEPELEPERETEINNEIQIDHNSEDQEEIKAEINTEINTENSTEEEGKQLNLFEERILSVPSRSRFRIIGQAFDTYWLIEFEDNLLMIDQHAAHEKVKYERLMKQYREKNAASQMLMPPIIVTLNGKEEIVLNEFMDVFTGLGFEIESFGANEYALRSVPVDLYGCNEQEMFLEVLDELSDNVGRTNPKVVEEKIASMSCKAAVKGNNSLSFEEAECLIDELLSLDNPYNCPHGRPTIVTISKYEMEKKFKRIV